MIPNGIYFLLLFLLLSLVVEFFLILKNSKLDKKSDIPRSFFENESTVSTETKFDSLHSKSNFTTLPSHMQIEKELLNDIEGGNPLGTSFLYFLLSASVLVVIGILVRLIFQSR